jgi:hypothetical protein
LLRSSNVAAGPSTLAVSGVFAVTSLTVFATFTNAFWPFPVPIVPCMLIGSCQALPS